MRRVPRSGEHKSIQDVWDWYEVQSRLSRAKRSEVLADLRADRPVSDPVFATMSIDDVNSFFGELDYLAMLDLLSAAEAAIRLNFLTRVEKRKKDLVSRRFRQLYKQKGWRVDLEGDLLATWKRLVPQTARAVGDFNGALGLRHWLAHGRYWDPKLGRDYSPEVIYDISHNLLSAIGA